ncbi:MAG: hypothetical protein GDA43_12915 [Hormoscilla sp. SP5CHS1]|nr:hypothetical protein [Hormoscilla sp. SP5CHS1]
MALAAKQERILVTPDRKTIPTEFARFIVKYRSSGVIVVSEKLAVEIVLEELVLIWSASSAEEWIDRIALLPL